MFCKNCGNQLSGNEMFCSKCGAKVITVSNEMFNNNQNINGANNINSQLTENTHSQNSNQPSVGMTQNFNNNIPNNEIEKNKSKKDTISIVLGIIGLVSVFILSVFVWPISIVGIIFGILALKENKKYKIGLILNIISLVIAIPLLIIYSNIISSKSSNLTTGTWDCKSFDGSGVNGDYIVTMTLNNNNQFMWNKYNDAEDNHVIGTYEFKNLHISDNKKTISYYQLTLTGDEFVSNGELQNKAYKSTYEMGILKNTDEALLTNITTYNMYYCYRHDKSNSEISSIKSSMK